MKRSTLERIGVVVLFVVIAFVGSILVVNAIMGYLVGSGEEVVAPDVVGQDVEDARAILRGRHLVLEVMDEVSSDDIAPGRIVRQNPRAGRRVKQGRPLEVVLSSGAERVAVPSLTGVPLGQASVFLRREGLVLADVARAHVPGSAPDEVVTSEPPPGEMVPRGTRVGILVSEGPPRPVYIMPDVVGRGEDGALDHLRQLGFEPRVVQVVGGGQGAGIVYAQKPPPGSHIEEGETVELTVAR
jgi:beta-lactam-binding protein with PASTA domain